MKKAGSEQGVIRNDRVCSTASTPPGVRGSGRGHKDSEPTTRTSVHRNDICVVWNRRAHRGRAALTVGEIMNEKKPGSRHTASDAVISGLCDLMRTLGNRTRLDIFMALVTQPRDVATLASDLELDQPVVSSHLSALRKRGLAMAVKVGKRRIYGLGQETEVIRRAGIMCLVIGPDDGLGLRIRVPQEYESTFAKWDAGRPGCDASSSSPARLDRDDPDRLSIRPAVRATEWNGAAADRQRA